MLTDKQIHSIQHERGRTVFPISYMYEVDARWNAAIKKLKECNEDLNKIPIVVEKKVSV